MTMKRWQSLLLGVTVSAVTLIIALRGNDLSQLGNELERGRYLYVVPSLALMWVVLVIKGIRWRVLLDRKLEPGYSFHILNVGNFLNQVLPMRLGEQTALHWGQVYSLPVVSLRLFNVYGPRSRTSGTYGAVFGVFLAQKLAGKPFTVVGDGTQTRDFTFVTDVVDAFITAAKSDVSGEVFNVGSGNTYSVNRLVELLGGEVVYIPKRPGEPDCTFADTRKIQQMLSWQPKVSFEQGVAAMLENIDYWREAPLWTPESISAATRDWFTYLGKTP